MVAEYYLSYHTNKKHLVCFAADEMFSFNLK